MLDNYGAEISLTTRVQRYGDLKSEYLGKWRITEMGAWDEDYVDMVVPGHFTVTKNGGEMEFGVVSCELDCRVEEFAGIERLEFSFLGMDEGDEVSGRGWAVIEENLLKGHIYFHYGDDSGFSARKHT